jgi:hypothetical protein
MAGLTSRFQRRFRRVSGAGPTVTDEEFSKAEHAEEHVVTGPDPGTNKTDGGWMPHGPVYTAIGIAGAAEIGVVAVQSRGGSRTLNLVAESGTPNLLAIVLACVIVLLSILGLLLVVWDGRRRPDRGGSHPTRRMPR